MDERAREFIKDVVDEDLQRKIVDVLFMDGASFDEEIESLIKSLEDVQ